MQENRTKASKENQLNFNEISQKGNWLTKPKKKMSRSKDWRKSGGKCGGRRNCRGRRQMGERRKRQKRDQEIAFTVAFENKIKLLRTNYETARHGPQNDDYPKLVLETLDRLISDQEGVLKNSSSFETKVNLLRTKFQIIVQISHDDEYIRKILEALDILSEQQGAPKDRWETNNSSGKEKENVQSAQKFLIEVPKNSKCVKRSQRSRRPRRSYKSRRSHKLRRSRNLDVLGAESCCETCFSSNKTFSLRIKRRSTGRARKYKRNIRKRRGGRTESCSKVKFILCCFSFTLL